LFKIFFLLFIIIVFFFLCVHVSTIVIIIIISCFFFFFFITPLLFCSFLYGFLFIFLAYYYYYYNHYCTQLVTRRLMFTVSRTSWSSRSRCDLAPLPPAAAATRVRDKNIVWTTKNAFSACTGCGDCYPYWDSYALKKIMKCVCVKPCCKLNLATIENVRELVGKKTLIIQIIANVFVCWLILGFFCCITILKELNI
jgi:hypothetical protein